MDGSANPGNFLAFLKMVARHEDALIEHLTSRAMGNATYLSPDIQNELIHIIGKEVIQSEIVEEIKKAKFFSIIAYGLGISNVRGQGCHGCSAMASDAVGVQAIIKEIHRNIFGSNVLVTVLT